tara:strand:+ start:894 stop:1220 length:327 start_codon:yes stop_codon:yes gene_type:complete
MPETNQVTTYKTLSYIHYSLYFIYLRCVLFLNALDHIIFSDMLENNDNTIKNNTNNFHSTRRDSFTSLNKHNEYPSQFSIFDVNKTNFINEHTRNQIDNMEELLFSDY